MKRLISALTVTLTVILLLASANANAKISCGPMVEKMNAKSDVVANFASELVKLESKLRRVENKLADKRSSISSLTADIQNEKQVITQKENDKLSMIQSVRSIANEKEDIILENKSLSHLMNQLSVQIQSLPVRSNALREALRERKRTEKKIESNQNKISFLDQQISPVKESIYSLEKSIMSSVSKVEVLRTKRNQVKNAHPTLTSLQDKKERAEIQLMQSDSVQQSNLVQLEQATEMVDMCKTYTVKYQLALSISKELYEVGCANYVPKSFNGFYKRQAHDDTVEQICGTSTY